MCHYQFETIHPFLDGNGRVGRLLITLLLIEKKMLPSPLLYSSAFFEATRKTYYDLLFQVSSTGAWHDWLTYFLNGVTLQSRDVLSGTERINNLISTWLAQATPRQVNAQEIIRLLAVNPYCTAKKVANDLSVSYSTAQRAIESLEALGVLQQTSASKRDRVYCAVKILAILEEPTALTFPKS